MIKYNKNELGGKSLDFTKEDTFACLYMSEFLQWFGEEYILLTHFCVNCVKEYASWQAAFSWRNILI